MDYAEKRRVKGHETERRILDAAQKLMREQGFAAVSVRDICREAGVTTGAFYHHFDSKEALLDRGYIEMDDYIRRHMQEAAPASGLARLEQVFTAYAAYMEEENGELTARFFQNLLSSPNRAAFAPDRFIHTAVCRYIQQAMDEGELTAALPAGEVAAFCIRHFRGIAVDWAFHQYAYSLSGLMRRDFALLCDLFRRKEK